MKKNILIKGLLFLLISINISFLPQESYAQNNLNIGIKGRDAIARNSAKLDFAFSDKGLKLGAPIFLRVFKDKSSLELWVKAKNGKYKYFRQYKICGANTKFIPTGIYNIAPYNLTQGNAKSLKIGTDYPNAYNVAKKQNGAINIAPFCVPSPEIGLTDPEMDEIFTIMYKAAKNGQRKIEIHVFPFELNQFNLFSARGKTGYETLKQLAPIYSYFESNRKLPPVSVNSAGYKIIKAK